MKPSIPYSNHGQGEPYYAGYHFPSTEQLPGFSTRMSFSPQLPEADPSSEWRFHTCWVNHAEEDETHLAYSNDAYGGGSASGYGPNHAMAGSWGTPAPQPLQNSGYPMVSVFYQMSSNNHSLILPFHEAEYSIQQPSTRRTLLRWVPLRRQCRAIPGSFDPDELFAPSPRGGPQSRCLFRMALPSAIR